MIFTTNHAQFTPHIMRFICFQLCSFLTGYSRSIYSPPSPFFPSPFVGRQKSFVVDEYTVYCRSGSGHEDGSYKVLWGNGGTKLATPVPVRSLKLSSLGSLSNWVGDRHITLRVLLHGHGQSLGSANLPVDEGQGEVIISACP